MISRRRMLAGIGSGLMLSASGTWSRALAARVSAKFSGPHYDLSDGVRSYFFQPTPGKAAPDRLVVFTVHASGGQSGDLESVSVGDMAATIDGVLRGPNGHLIAFASLPLPVDTDNTLVNVRLSTPRSRCILGVWTLYGVSRKPTIFHSEFRSQASASVAIRVPDGGLCICAFQASLTRFSWSQATPVYGKAIERSVSIGGAVAVNDATVTATPSRSPVNCGLLAGVWA